MRTAICGVWHVHTQMYYEKAAGLGEVIGVYDADVSRRKAFCEKNGLREFASLEELLASDAEGVIVCTATGDHADVMVRIADAGKHIFTEKVLAFTEEECERIEEAVSRNHVNFVISLVQKYDGARRAVKAIADSGELGRLNYIRFRNCHNGSTGKWLPPHFYNRKECGGGAMMDLGAHGMYLIHWFCGDPVTASSSFTVFCDDPEVVKNNSDRVEDNAVTVMTYPNGCIAVNETGFVSKGSPAALEVGGEKGYVRMDADGIVKTTEATDMKPVKVEPADTLPMPIEQFMTGKILEGCGIEEAKALTRMMVMAYRNIAKAE